MFCFDGCADSGVIESDGTDRFSDDDRSLDFPLSDTRLSLLVLPGRDGVIDSDFGRSGSLRFEANICLYLLSGILVIDIDEDGSFTDPVDFLFDCALLVLALEEDALELDDPMAVDVIDSELLIKFC